MTARRDLTEDELRERMARRREQNRARMARQREDARAVRNTPPGVTPDRRSVAHSRSNAVCNTLHITHQSLKDSLGTTGGSGGAGAPHAPTIPGLVVGGCYYPPAAFQKNPGPPPGVLACLAGPLERVDPEEARAWFEAQARIPLRVKLAQARQSTAG